MKFNKNHKLVLFIVLISCFAQFTNIADAQCEGVYFKTIYRKLFTERVYFDLNLKKDLTGDGKIDLIGYHFSNTSSNVIGVYILPNDGNGGFNSQLIDLPIPVSIAFGAINVLDFNSDGRNDLIISLSSTNSIFVYRNDSNGAFTALPTTQLVTSEITTNVLDINNDGFADLLTVLGSLGQGPNSYYRLGNASGSFGNQVQLPSGDYSIGADFNGDGKIDFPVLSGTSPNYTMGIYYNQGNGAFSLGSNFINLGSSVPRTAADFNNDGKIDLLALSYPNSLSIIKNLGNDSFSKADYPLPPITTTGISVGSPGIADFNGDGFLDIISGSQAAPFYSIYTNNGSGLFARRDYNNRIAGGIVNDLDGDGKADLIGQNQFNFFNEGIGFRLFNETRLTIEKSVCNKQGQTKLIDFNEDLIADKTFFRQSDGRWLYKKSVSPFADVSFSWGLAGDIPTLGDYDGDGVTDYAVFRPSNGVWYIRKSSDGNFIFVRFGLNGDKPIPSDFDGDGKTDIAVYRPSDGNWHVVNSFNQQVSTTHFGSSEDKPLPEDYDGDGKSDFAVFRPSSGIWYYLKSIDGNFAAIKWGINSDKPVPADYDSDGKADIAVFRESEGIWHILRSSNSQYSAFRFGSVGDIPQPTDWDGNGIIDLGIYRPNSFNWYSTDGTYQFTFGSIGD
jgi:hypothetical protein